MPICTEPTHLDQPAERLREFFDEVSGPLMGFLLRLTRGEHHLAEDLLQETFLRAWRRIDDLPGDSASARPWLFTVARRASIDAMRARRVRPAETQLPDTDISADPVDLADRVVDARVVRDALPKLTPMHREMIIEVYFRDREARDIARRLSIPEGTVKSRTFYAVRSLGEVIGELGPER